MNKYAQLLLEKGALKSVPGNPSRVKDENTADPKADHRDVKCRSGGSAAAALDQLVLPVEKPSVALSESDSDEEGMVGVAPVPSERRHAKVKLHVPMDDSSASDSLFRPAPPSKTLGNATEPSVSAASAPADR